MPDSAQASNLLHLLKSNLDTRRRLGLGQVRGDDRELEKIITASGIALPSRSERPSTINPPQTPAKGADKSYGHMSLEQIRRNLGQCNRCPLSEKRNHIVFGQGPENARVLFIGEAPGRQEDLSGIPFVGPAGKLLDQMLHAVGLERGRVYITNIVKCRPPQNRDPKPEEAAVCRPFLDAQIKAIRPTVICTLGRPSAQALLETDAPISALRGKWKKLGQTPLLPTFHPAYLLRQPDRKAQAYKDLKELAGALAGKSP